MQIQTKKSTKKWLLEEQRFRDKNVTKKTIITTAKQIQKVTEHLPNTNFIIPVAKSNAPGCKEI